MDKIQELVITLSEDDKREFRVFINRQKSKKERKDLDLFELINLQTDPKEIQKKLYKTPNKVAYHTLRKRLLKHLTDFILLKQLDEDTTSKSSILGLISLSSYLFKKLSTEMAWRFLLKAEKLAVDSEQFEELNNIYQLQIEYADTEFAPNIDGICKKWEKNKSLVLEGEKTNIAYSYIKKELNDIKIRGEYKDLEIIINTILKQHKLENVAFKRPETLYKVLDLTRQVMFSKKDFYSFEPYIIKNYKELIANKGFSKRNHYYKIRILYMVAHVLYRNRKFKDSILYLGFMYTSTKEYNRFYYHQFLPKYIQLKSANQVFIGDNASAINLLNEIPKKEISKMPPFEQLNIQLSLCVYYFNQSRFKEANAVIQQIGHSANWLEKKMGKEWVLKMNLIDIIVQYEIGNIDIVLNRIRSFERNFSSFTEHPIYKRAFIFIELIKVFIDTPEAIDTEEFKKEISKKIIDNKPQEQEDLQAMAFYCWIKSKVIKQDYYSVLLDIANYSDIYPPLLQNT